MCEVSVSVMPECLRCCHEEDLRCMTLAGLLEDVHCYFVCVEGGDFGQKNK